MANRHLLRSVAMQSLFEADFNDFDSSKIDSIVKRNVEEFAPGIDDAHLAGDIVHGVLKHQKKIDTVIAKAAPEWPLDQIAIVDRNVLRIGLYELLFGKKREVPSKVAINEAIELAKTFGGDSSSKFVNGVLGTIYREIGGEEKDVKPIEEKLAGAIVYRKDEKGGLWFAFVHDVFGFWTLSKGHLDVDEKAEDGLKREIKAEMGVDIEIEKELGSNEYTASDPERGKVKKTVTYFLASTKDENLQLEKGKGGLDGVEWFAMKDLGDLKMYEDMRPIVAKGIRLLMNDANMRM